MNDTFTICKQCKHFHNIEPTGPRKDIWYNHYCKAVDLPTAQDPLDGVVKPFSQNDLGRTIFLDEPYPHCRDINDGNCKAFEQGEDS